uniref:endo-1,4-beta-xylanase n=1 Tax=uncultured microorganism TaxID=358574 RepID=A0A7U1BNC6_9ZZZZ|nr:1,4-beta-xylanase [uncultured microorganism]
MTDHSAYLATADALIREHRTAQATVTLFDRDRIPLANQQVTVSQRKHKFLFGCNGFGTVPLVNHELEGPAKVWVETYAERLLGLFNAITLPFYWGRFEPKRGHPDTQRLLKTARWLVERGCVLKGHTLCWHTVTADWLLELSNAEILETQIARVRREVSDFAGLVDMWDVLNEVVIMPVFDKYDNGITRICQELGRVGMVRTMFDAARAANPAAVLLLNDFDTSPDYEALIQECLEAGIKIDVIGIQSHMHQGYWGVDKTLDVLDRFARFGLPIHFTEITLVSGQIMPPDIVDLNDYRVSEWPTTPEGEARQASEVVSFYKTLLAHPAVEAITWWDLTDGGWLGAPAGLVRRDNSPKPAYEALSNLIKGEWWLDPVEMVTDGEGRLQVNGFLGEYTLAWAGRTAPLYLDKKGTLSVEVHFD